MGWSSRGGRERLIGSAPALGMLTSPAAGGGVTGSGGGRANDVPAIAGGGAPSKAGRPGCGGCMNGLAGCGLCGVVDSGFVGSGCPRASAPGGRKMALPRLPVLPGDCHGSTGNCAGGTPGIVAGVGFCCPRDVLKGNAGGVGAGLLWLAWGSIVMLADPADRGRAGGLLGIFGFTALLPSDKVTLNASWSLPPFPRLALCTTADASILLKTLSMPPRKLPA